MLEIKNISKIYKDRVNVIALRDISLSINDGDYISISGRSGSGKTTLLNLVGTLDVPTSGEIIYDEANPFKLNDDELSRFRNKNVGFVFQEFELIAELTALQNVALPLQIGGMKRRESLKIAGETIKKVGMEERKNHYPSQLSGGEKQRIAIARAIINNPEILLCDEPTGELDEESAGTVIDLIDQLNSSGVTVLLVSHSDVIAAHAKKHYKLINGELSEA
jgi:putative ABC transport system ATP-binding protein